MSSEAVPTNDGSMTLAHRDHGETYHSRLGAWSEATSLYIEGSGIQSRFAKEELSVLDIGLGLGYNAIATITCWLNSTNSRNLYLYSYENDEQLFDQLVSGSASWQANWKAEWLQLVQLPQKVEDGHWVAEILHQSGAKCFWHIRIADARIGLQIPNERKANFVWQDAFSPTTCPELWTKDWFDLVHRQCLPGAVLMTYSVARRTRDALEASSWAWQKISAQGGAKKQWLTARSVSAS